MHRTDWCSQPQQTAVGNSADLVLVLKKNRQWSYNVTNTEALSRNHCCRGKAIHIRYYECVSVVSSMKSAERMRRFILSSVVRLAVPYFFTLAHIRRDLRGGELPTVGGLQSESSLGDVNRYRLNSKQYVRCKIIAYQNQRTNTTKISVLIQPKSAY